MKFYSTFDIEKKLKLNRNTVQSLLDGKFFTPSIRASGKGTRNKFSTNDVYRLVLFFYLTDVGLSREEAKVGCDVDFNRDFSRPNIIKIRTKLEPVINIEVDLRMVKLVVDFNLSV